MKLNKLIEITNRGYSDGYLSMYYDTKKHCVKQDPNNDQGDTLALFLVRELIDTFQPDFTDVEQLKEAQYAIDNAINELMDVRHELDKAIVKREGL